MSSGDLTFHRRWSGDDEVLPGDFRWNGRPLVVIDPEDREAVERLMSAYFEHGWTRTPDDAPIRTTGVDYMQAALREFANPKPPKPDEPQGLGAVVEDAAGTPWVRCENADLEPHWYARNKKRDWPDLDAVRVLSEGVRP